MGGVENEKNKSNAMASSSCDHPVVSLPFWGQEAAESITFDDGDQQLPPIAVVCGPGNSGKSSFSRNLLNTLLKRYKRVGYLDTDVGQPEFTPPGCLSLHIIDKPSPDLTILSLKTPEKCFFYGDVNCQKDTKVYSDNILSLFDYFREAYNQTNGTDDPVKNMLPLVVNTSGWVKGHGFDLLVKMLKYISPTHVAQIRVSAESKNLPKGMFWLDECEKGSAKLFEISAAKKDPARGPALIRKEARMLRDLRIIAYFRQCLPEDLEFASYEELTRSLASIRAHELSLSKFKVIQLHSQDSSGNEISRNLNATIVGFGISCLLEDSTPWCTGLGFVRDVDVSEDLLKVITPVSLRMLEKADCILQGNIEVPSCLLQKVDAKGMEAEIAKTTKKLSGLLSIN